MSVITFKNGKIEVAFNTLTLLAEFRMGEKVWRQNPKLPPCIQKREGKEFLNIDFSTAKNVDHTYVKSGPYNGVKSTYSGLFADDGAIDISFQTFIWIDGWTSDVNFEFLPLIENSDDVLRVMWPPPLDMGNSADGYAVIPNMQGYIVYNSDSDEVLNVTARVYARGCSMPWFGQVASGAGYMCVIETPWDALVQHDHLPMEHTDVRVIWGQSLGRIGYQRSLRYRFYENCDYVKFCSDYRQILCEKGELVTLLQKADSVPGVAELAGIPVICSDSAEELICHNVEPTSRTYDRENPSNNHKFRKFSSLAEKFETLSSRGLRKAYVYIAGWGKRGYDNLHPDILPPCAEAGGANGLKDLLERARKIGYIPALRDQFRDFYLDAETYDRELAIQDAAGNVRLIDAWAGGHHNILCAQAALAYVKRNYLRMREMGILPDSSYLDTFSATDIEECFHPEHRMTRRECMERRIECFEYIRSLGLIVSSEEPIGCFIPHLDIVHRAPWSFTSRMIGVPVPLLNLVYHDCLIIPWYTGIGGTGIPETDSEMLHALLNGGSCYINESASPDMLTRVEPILRLHRQVAFSMMVSHKFIDGNLRRQQTEFSDGTKVTADFDTLSYRIELASGQIDEGVCKH